ncbi:MAG: nicotinate phosphoribosyltransferase, partial [Candidatus Bathyarchaeota archaeon]
MPRFHIASDEAIKRGNTTDIYFIRTEEIIRAKRLDSTTVLAEVTVGALPRNCSWAVLTGIEEEAHLLNGLPVDVDAMPEGTVFHPRDINGVRLPVMHIAGAYASFCRYETALLGLLCQSSGMATAAAKVRKAAGRKRVINFGARRMHPSLSPLIGRSAYIGGLDGVSSLAAAKLIGVLPTGTMPHALIIVYGDQVDAWKAFD